jgi:hypothetical protein
VTSALAHECTFKHQDTLVTAPTRFICPGGRDFTVRGPWLVVVVGTGGSGVYVFPITPVRTYATPTTLADADATVTLTATAQDESWRTLATATGNRAISIDASAAKDGVRLVVTRYDNAAFTWTFTDVTSGDVTTLPAGRAAWAEWQVVSGAAQLRRWS